RGPLESVGLGNLLALSDAHALEDRRRCLERRLERRPLPPVLPDLEHVAQLPEGRTEGGRKRLLDPKAISRSCATWHRSVSGSGGSAGARRPRDRRPTLPPPAVRPGAPRPPPR